MGYFCHALINKAVVKLSEDGRKKTVCNFSAAGGEDKGKIVKLEHMIERRKNHCIQKMV